MAEMTASLLRLMAWLSPTFPVGSFSYSQGLERAVHDGMVVTAQGLGDWIAALLEAGAGWNEAVLFCEAWRSAGDETVLAELAELAEALAGSQERHRETMLLGSAFLTAARGWPGLVDVPLPVDAPYPVAVGSIAGANGVALETGCAAYLQAYASNMIQAAIRLSVVGQTDAVKVLALLEATVLTVARRAARSSLDGLGTATIMAEIVSMRHETQYSRLFRS